MKKRAGDMFLFGGAIINRRMKHKTDIGLLCGLVGLALGFAIFGFNKNIFTPILGAIGAVLGFFVLSEKTGKNEKKSSKQPNQAL